MKVLDVGNGSCRITYMAGNKAGQQTNKGFKMTKQQMKEAIANRVKALRQTVEVTHENMFLETGLTKHEFEQKAKDWQWLKMQPGFDSWYRACHHLDEGEWFYYNID